MLIWWPSLIYDYLWTEFFWRRFYIVGFLKNYSVLFCFNYKTAWNAFKWVLPNWLQNTHSGDSPNKKVAATFQLQHNRHWSTWLIEISPISCQELCTATSWLTYQNHGCYSLALGRIRFFLPASPISFYELTDHDLSLSWIGIFLWIHVQFWPLRGQWIPS